MPACSPRWGDATPSRCWPGPRQLYGRRWRDSPLAAFTAFRQANLRVLRRATPADLQRVMRHAERGDEALGQMIRMFAGHDLVHLRQIGRIRQAIGAAPVLTPTT